MSTLSQPDDATSCGTSAASENVAQSASVETDQARPAEAAQPASESIEVASPKEEENVSSGDPAAAKKQAPQASSQDTKAAAPPPPAATTQPTSNIAQKSSHVSNLKTSSSLSLPSGGSSGSEDMMDLFSPPLSTNTRKNPRAMTVVTAADSVLRDREEVVLPFGQGLASRQTGNITRTPRTETHREKSPPSSGLDLQFNSSGEDFDAALQLTFEESPEASRARGSPLAGPPKNSDIPQQFRPPQQRQPSKQQKQERTAPKQQQQQPPPQQQGVPAAPAAGQMQPPYPYPVFYPHPYGGQMMPPGTNQMPPGAYAYPGQMMSGVVPMPGYGYPPWGSPPGQYYGYPPMMVPHEQYPMHTPATPASAKKPCATPGKKTATPGKRKERRPDANLTVDTAELSFDEMATPMSPASSKKKRDGLEIGTWPSPPHDYMNDDIGSSITPQRGSTTASRPRRGETPSNAPRLSSFDENFSFGATPGREILQAPSWSPGAMGAFFEDEGMLDGDPVEPASIESWEMSHSFGEVGNTHDQRQYMSAPHPSQSFMSEASPSRGGITIRGSPISSKAVRSADRAEFPLTTPSSKKAGKSQYPSQGSWQTPSNCAVRIRIGSAGLEKSKAKSNIDDINSVLRRSPVSTAPTGFPHPTALRASPAQNSMYSGIVMPSGNAGMTTPAATRRGGVGKENTENDRVTTPCNCKKSKCLKLYCECFASENYCFGCKCSNCQNTPQYQDIRDKAIADTKAKNPVAFQAKIDKIETEHATGCKCKKSACLKKYCECFEGGVVCGDNCKCSGCQNFVGSQTLMDRRRKMKHTKDRFEATTVVKSAQKAWSDSKVSQFGQSPIIHDPNRPIMRSPMHHPFMASQPAYQPHPVMLGQSPIVYPHGMMYQPHPYSAPRANPYSSAARTDHPAMQVPVYPHYPIDSTPRTTRTQFDPHGSAKKPARKMESKDPYFGPNVPKQTKTTALSIFSFLNNEELYNASIVSKTWSSLAFDNELWQPASGKILL